MAGRPFQSSWPGSTHTARLRSSKATIGTAYMDRFGEKVSFIWSIANLLRDDYKKSEYGRAIPPLTVMTQVAP